MHKCLYIILALNTSGCAITNSNCGLPADVYSKVKQYNIGPINGASDDNNDGQIDQYEAFGYWDFEQLSRVFQFGEPYQAYKWTNVDTCYVFNVNAKDYFEDSNQGILYQTCRSGKSYDFNLGEPVSSSFTKTSPKDLPAISASHP